jgi:hypothetical protein
MTMADIAQAMYPTKKATKEAWRDRQGAIRGAIKDITYTMEATGKRCKKVK